MDPVSSEKSRSEKSLEHFAIFSGGTLELGSPDRRAEMEVLFAT